MTLLNLRFAKCAILCSSFERCCLLKAIQHCILCCWTCSRLPDPYSALDPPPPAALPQHSWCVDDIFNLLCLRHGPSAVAAFADVSGLVTPDQVGFVAPLALVQREIHEVCQAILSCLGFAGHVGFIAPCCLCSGEHYLYGCPLLKDLHFFSSFDQRSLLKMIQDSLLQSPVAQESVDPGTLLSEQDHHELDVLKPYQALPVSGISHIGHDLAAFRLCIPSHPSDF